MLKTCSYCKEEKDTSEFYKNKNYTSGLSYYCKVCNALYNRKDYEKDKLNKKCINCAKPSLKNNNSCIYHWAYQIVKIQSYRRKYDLDKDEAALLVRHLLGKLSNQNFRCAYSGVVLIPGVNCSLEHKEAYGKTQDNSLGNLVWVDVNLNKLKGFGNKEKGLEKFNFYIEAIKTGEYPNYE